MPDTDYLSKLSLEGLLESLPVGMFLVDLQQRIVYWNPAAEKITGFTAEEAVGQHCSFLKGVPCGTRCGLYDEQVPKPVTGVPCTIETREERRITLSKSVDYLRGENGEVIGGVESFVDISRMKELERRLRQHAQHMEREVAQRTAELEEERSQLRAVLDAMSDFAYISSPDFRIEFMNRAMIEAFGDQQGRICYRAFEDSETPCEGCPILDIRSGQTVRKERELTRTGRIYDVVHTPVRSSDGTLSKLAVFRDITERKEAEEKLRETNRELDAFVYTVSHDLRAPLTPIIGYAEYLLENSPRLGPEERDILGEIERQGQRMYGLMEDLLALSRVGQVEPPEQPVDAEGVVRDVLQQLSAEINAGKIQVLTGYLPPVLVPETLLFNLFSNLIGNAVRYAGSQGRIEVEGRRTGPNVIYCVRDFGPGIPAAEAQRIFDPFYRGGSSAGTTGTGIGLATVRKIARLYGGRAWVEETSGGGATFCVEFNEEFSAAGDAG